MEILFGIVVFVVVIAIAIVVYAAVFRLTAMWMSGEDIGWGESFLVVVLGSIANAIATALLNLAFGQAATCISFFVGFFVWGGVIAVVTGLDLSQSVVIAFLMSVLMGILAFVLSLSLIGWMITAGGVG